MAAVLSMWEQSAQYDPTNPNQITHVRYAGLPGGYSSFYYNKIKPTAVLQGTLGSVLDPSSWPDWLQSVVVGGVGLMVGYFGMRKYGSGLKKKLGLNGYRRRRR